MTTDHRDVTISMTGRVVYDLTMVEDQDEIASEAEMPSSEQSDHDAAPNSSETESTRSVSPTSSEDSHMSSPPRRLILPTVGPRLETLGRDSESSSESDSNESLAPVAVPCRVNTRRVSRAQQRAQRHRDERRLRAQGAVMQRETDFEGHRQAQRIRARATRVQRQQRRPVFSFQAQNEVARRLPRATLAERNCASPANVNLDARWAGWLVTADGETRAWQGRINGQGLEAAQVEALIAAEQDYSEALFEAEEVHLETDWRLWF